ncbi:glycosyltransferase [Rhizobium sp. Pop5]|uniref:glycosyltransferase family 2 protein n=1 Tax=Rhizobium sp. Pop5 TaxID=1223565 RepID=UPI000283D417|nr:glycosyltransferase [Rhizobium sp. Pop5]EJZ20297.1 family 2 glycosyl transferase [Rhizobium sp. Pop5]UVD57481.1 glycosyltransferase [Rhizobium sp. Pop5]
MKLSVVLGTYNRLDQLMRCVESIIRETTASTKIYVTDAGSTDGTIEYLRSIASETIIPILVGEKLGQAKAYNDVFEIVDTPYVCWLSDDNEVTAAGLDRALKILERDSRIGMVALKTRDVQGPFLGTPYIGGISPAGILNVNQGMLPTSVLKEVGGFSEEFRDYGIDPALTAEVLFSGYKIVYTREVALLHYRNWNEDPKSENRQWIRERHARAKELYLSRYSTESMKSSKAASKFRGVMKRVGRFFFARASMRSSALARDLLNVTTAKYISFMDPVLTWNKSYHLVQKIPVGRQRITGEFKREDG